MKTFGLLVDLVLILLPIVSFFGIIFFSSQGNGLMAIICGIVWYFSFMFIARDD